MFNFKAIVLLSFINLTKCEYYEKCVKQNHITLTFDDGIHKNTQELVNVLNKYGIKGTFFINGIHIVRNTEFEDVIKQMYIDRHIIGTHTFSHAVLEKLNEFNILRELYDNELIFRELFNIRPRYMRPPYFSYNDIIYNIITYNFGYDLIGTNVMINDFDGISAETIYNFMVNKLITEPTTGKIILQHDKMVNNIEALEIFIEYGLSNNYTFVDLTECLGHNQAYIEDNKYGPNLNTGININ